MSHKKTDFGIAQSILLGGKISAKHKAFQVIARMSPDYADVYMFLIKILPNIEKGKDPLELALEIIETFGMVDFVRNTTEITRLAMILGDTRKMYSGKELTNLLNKPLNEYP